jgi:hypothetical protein
MALLHNYTDMQVAIIAPDLEIQSGRLQMEVGNQPIRTATARTPIERNQRLW